MKKNKNIYNIILYLFVFLFIFTMFNREFIPFGLDLRMISLPLGIIILLVKVFKDKKISFNKEDTVGNLFILFYSIMFIFLISWIWNKLPVNNQKLINEIILIFNTFVGLMVFYFNKEKIDKDKINLFVIISSIVLALSIVLVHQGIEFKYIMGSGDEKSIYESSNAAEQKNIFGEDFRTAGYASDPNYATMLLIIGIVCTLKCNYIRNRMIKIINILLFLVCIGFSFSKSIILASIIITAYLAFLNLFNIKNYNIKKINTFIVLFIFIIAVTLPNLEEFIKLPQTLTTRFSMWRSGYELFLKSPIIGNGLTSFRSFFSLNNWYVQAHSTYWQIISEIGIIGIFIYLTILKKSLDLSVEKKYDYFLKLIFVIWIITCESVALPFSVFILYINSIDFEKKKYSKKALFFINTLSNGGAEKVCINMANELILQGFKVDFILLNSDKKMNNNYKLDKRNNIYNLDIKTDSKFREVLSILKSINKVNSIIEQNEKDGSYMLIASHLPMSNILTRLSCVKNRAIYVFHSTIESYDRIGSKKLFKLLFDFMYKNKKVVTVSEGLRKEAINKYGLSDNKVKTVYNPINMNEINKLKGEKIDINDKYFIQIGRFSKAKRQDRMVEVFFKGEFYKKYKLVFCGIGELEDKIKKQVDNLGIKDRVMFLGWQKNVYKWMKNSEILISTSDYEAFPMNLVEAFACDTKVVSSDCDFGPSEILLGEYGKYLVKTDDIDDYINKINLALDIYPQKSNKIIESCKPENIIKQYIDFMKSDD